MTVHEYFKEIVGLPAAIGAAVLLINPVAHAQRESVAPPPTYANVSYGSHERHVLDFWQVDSVRPAPVVLYFHAGGFTGGSKEVITMAGRRGHGASITNVEAIEALLDIGISVAAVNYRLMDQAPLPAAFADSMRAVQFLRYKGDDWNIDKTRVGAFGSSAGAIISMWLAFRDDMADPDSDDAIARESSRLRVIGSQGGQTSLFPTDWAEWLPVDEAPAIISNVEWESKDPDQVDQHRADTSAIRNISADDPPLYMTYAMRPDDPVPSDPAVRGGWLIHHVSFGIELKKAADQLGVEAHLVYPGNESVYRSVAEFFATKLDGR